MKREITVSDVLTITGVRATITFVPANITHFIFKLKFKIIGNDNSNNLNNGHVQEILKIPLGYSYLISVFLNILFYFTHLVKVDMHPVLLLACLVHQQM